MTSSNRHVQGLGATMMTLLPPCHGTMIRCSESGILEFFDRLPTTLDIPIMIQDAPISGTNLSVEFLTKLARD